MLRRTLLTFRLQPSQWTETFKTHVCGEERKMSGEAEAREIEREGVALPAQLNAMLYLVLERPGGKFFNLFSCLRLDVCRITVIRH